MPSLVAIRHAPWSTSKARCALRCSQEFHFRYVDKIPEPQVGPELRLGKAVHAALEGMLLQRVPLAEALAAGRNELLTDEERARFDGMSKAVAAFGERIDAFRQRRHVRSEMVEHKLAVRADLTPTLFHGKDAFFRGVWDAGFVFDDFVIALVDHKTGMRRPATEFSEQLGGYAMLAAAHLPEVKRVWLGVHFVESADLEWAPPIDADTVFELFAPRIVDLIERAAENVARGPTTTVGPWCPRCSYHAICPAMRALDGAEVAAWSAPGVQLTLDVDLSEVKAEGRDPA
ncbi:MAG: PD-(D/E)XK nuclease family protein [Thermodesulfobacteriota bacterium]